MMVFGILSDKRAYKSLSPAMHNRVLADSGLQGVYVPLAVAPENIGPAVAGLRALNLAGANVTVPYKEAVIPHLDELTAEAKKVGAVNTIINAGGVLKGHNTDAQGFANALAGTGQDFSNGSALIIGSGGAAKAILHALKLAGLKRLRILGRNRETVQALARKHRAGSGGLDQLEAGLITEDLIINCSSISSLQESPDLAGIVGGINSARTRLVVDLNYGREQNIWQGLANRLGAQFQDGLPLLAHQAALSFTAWTGLEIDPANFMSILENR